jgi:hypothetical protein
MQPELIRLGAEGWEAVTSAGTDKTLGLNALVIILKRQIVPPPSPPAGTQPGWYDDPCGRWEKRYWDGSVWTAHVADLSGKKQKIDPPQTLPPPA